MTPLALGKMLARQGSGAEVACPNKSVLSWLAPLPGAAHGSGSYPTWSPKLVGSGLADRSCFLAKINGKFASKNRYLGYGPLPPIMQVGSDSVDACSRQD
jgi:hypothetical protein